MRIPRIPLWAAALAVLGAFAVAYPLRPHTVLWELVVYDGAVVLVVACMVLGLRRNWRTRRAPWLAALIGMTVFLVAELIWWAYVAVDREPFPSIADGFFLAGYAGLGVAAALLARGGDGEDDRSAWLDAMLLALVCGLLIWAWLGQSVATDTSVSVFARTVTLAYPAADVLLLGMLLRLLLAPGARSGASTLFALGLIATLLGDLAFLWADAHDGYVSGTWIDGAWLLGYAFIGVAPLHPSATREPRAQAIHGLGRGRLAFVLGAVLVPVVVLARELHLAGLDGLSTPTVAVAVAAATMLLVAGRLWMLLGRARRFEAARGAERLSALVDHSADAILLLGPDLAVRFASPATAEIWGAPVDTYLGQTFPQMLAGEDRSAFARQLRGLASDTGASSAPIEGWLQPAEGPPRAFEGTARNLLDNPSVDAIVITLRDVTHRRELEAQLERRALHDPLTGLANRTLFTDRVRHALQRAVRQPAAGTAVVFIDLDDFKAVNDGMGHGAGDELLREVGGRLRSCIRPADTVARLGGDEFALLLEDLDTPDQARHLAERALEMLKMPLHVGDLDLAVPASAGIAFATPDCTVDTILRDADLAMYSAKNAGKSQVAMFDDALRDVAARRLALRAALPEALRLDQFRLAYQPIHDVADRHLRGFEALLRWDHPEDGEVSPADFIPDAEESGLIVDIGRWVLHQACLQAAEWNRLAARPLEMSVNVSGVQLRHPAFLTDVAQALANAGLPANHLTLEITESVLIDHGDDMAVLTSLREMGVGLALDDFGTGYSSLAYLQRFPVTSVKIDRAFVSQLSSGGDDALVRSVVAIAEALSLTTVAEGVETDEQLSILDGLECALAQGYHVGRPESAEHITELISRAAVSGS